MAVFLAMIAWFFIHNKICTANCLDFMDFLPLLFPVILLVPLVWLWFFNRKALETTGNSGVLSFLMKKYEECGKCPVKIFYYRKVLKSVELENGPEGAKPE